MIRVLAFIRSLIAVVFLFPVYTIAMSLTAILVTSIGRFPKINNRIVGLWATGVCWMFGVEVKTFGLETVPKGTFVLLFTHKSFFDVFAISKVLPDVRFGAKIELFRIPIFGTALKRMGILPIARGKVESVMRVYKAAEERTKRGERFALAPEGGRNTTTEALLPFKSGPFLFGISAKSPLQPLVIRGAVRVWPKGYLVPQPLHLKSTIELHFLESVPVTDLGFEKTAEMKNFLQKKLFQQMHAKILSLRESEAARGLASNHEDETISVLMNPPQ